MTEREDCKRYIFFTLNLTENDNCKCYNEYEYDQKMTPEYCKPMFPVISLVNSVKLI